MLDSLVRQLRFGPWTRSWRLSRGQMYLREMDLPVDADAWSGYEGEDIKVASQQAFDAVLASEGAYERDSVLFRDKQVNAPLVRALSKLASRYSAPLHIVDVGGGFGSQFFQHRTLLNDIGVRKWTVIEQEWVVDYAKSVSLPSSLEFRLGLDSSLAASQVDLVILSGFLQYVPSPAAWIQEVCSLAAPMILVDRTPVALTAQPFTCMQYTSRRIYLASYPCWIFSREWLIHQFAGEYDPMETEHSLDSTAHTSRGRVVDWEAILFGAKAKQ